MKGIKFLSLLTLIATVASIVYLTIDTGDYHLVYRNLEESTLQTLTFTQKFKSFFTHADSWNYLTLVAFIAILIFLFVLNDYLIGQFLHSKMGKKKSGSNGSFVGGGLVWLIRMITSAGLVFVEFVVLS